MQPIPTAHVLPGVQWMDSIADPVGERINRSREERRTIQSLAIDNGAWGEMRASLIPLLAWAKRSVNPSAYFTPAMRPFMRAISRYISLSRPREPNARALRPEQFNSGTELSPSLLPPTRPQSQ